MYILYQASAHNQSYISSHSLSCLVFNCRGFLQEIIGLHSFQNFQNEHSCGQFFKHLQKSSGSLVPVQQHQHCCFSVPYSANISKISNRVPFLLLAICHLTVALVLEKLSILDSLQLILYVYNKIWTLPSNYFPSLVY